MNEDQGLRLSCAFIVFGTVLLLLFTQATITNAHTAEKIRGQRELPKRKLAEELAWSGPYMGSVESDDYGEQFKRQVRISYSRDWQPNETGGTVVNFDAPYNSNKIRFFTSENRKVPGTNLWVTPMTGTSTPWNALEPDGHFGQELVHAATRAARLQLFFYGAVCILVAIWLWRRFKPQPQLDDKRAKVHRKVNALTGDDLLQILEDFEFEPDPEDTTQGDA